MTPGAPRPAGVYRDFTAGDVRPQAPGMYERRTAIGVSRDLWDGGHWRRTNRSRTICANQALPWRLLQQTPKMTAN